MRLVENESYKFGIVGSANRNQNHRVGAGVDLTVVSQFDYFKLLVNEDYHSAIPYAVDG